MHHSNEEPLEELQLPSLTDCFAKVCKWHGLEMSELDAVGLPLDATPSLLNEAAQKLGLKLSVVRRKLAGLPVGHSPVIACLKQGACVLTPASGAAGEKWRVTWPQEAGVFSKVPGIAGNVDEATDPSFDLEQEYAGYLLTLEVMDAAGSQAAAAPLKGMRWILEAISSISTDFVFMILASLCIHVVALGLPMLTMTVYNRVVPNGAMETLWVLVIAATGAYTFDFVVRILRGRLSDSVAKAADHILARRLISHTLSLELSSRPASAGNLAGRLRHYETVREFFTSATVLGLVDMPFAMLMTLLIFWLAGPVGLIPLGFGLLSMLVTLAMQPWQRHLLKESFGLSLDRQALTTEAINALETIKAANASGHMERRMMEIEENSAAADLKLKRVSNFGNSFTAWCSNLCSIAVIIGSVFEIQAKHLSMGGMIACVMVAGRAMAPLAGAAGLLMRVQQMMVSVRSLRDLLALPGENDRVHVRQKIRYPEFKMVTVMAKYPGQPNPSLRDVSLVIKPGERVALIGRAGSGKTTLLRLLSRTNLATEGQVLVDGLDIGQISPSNFRAICGYLPQDPVLMHGTLRSNLVMGREHSLDDNALLKAAQRAGVVEWANRHPKGFDMQVGERGTMLSGGERQMVAAARAILTEPDVIFLDEPTSSLDLTTEKRFCAALAEYLAEDPRRTMIMATHKMSLLSLVDRVILLDGGKVQLDGPRDQVIAALQQASAAPPPASPTAQASPPAPKAAAPESTDNRPRPRIIGKSDATEPATATA